MDKEWKTGVAGSLQRELQREKSICHFRRNGSLRCFSHGVPTASVKDKIFCEGAHLLHLRRWSKILFEDAPFLHPLSHKYNGEHSRGENKANK
jgi:hypothetical protein